jgi:hypothetical protein
MPSDQFVPVTVPLYSQGHAYRAGSRIRVRVSAPNGDQPIWSFSETEPAGTAEVEIGYGNGMPSRLVLPQVPGVTVPAQLPPCPGLRGEPCRDYVPFQNDTSVLDGYARPKGATPIYASLVPAYQPCAAPDRTHGPPLAFGSCASPAQSSDQLTVGTADANGAVAKMVGSVRYRVIAGDPGTAADEADVDLAVSVTDVRRQGDLGDYTGELQVNAPLQITDRLNGPSDLPGTAQEISFPVTVGCAPNADPAVGSTCSLATTLDAVTPGAVPEGARSIWQMGEVEVRDADGAPFLRQGIFVP